MNGFVTPRFFAFRAPRPALLIALGILLAVMLSACGKKGPVRPKLASQPAAPTEVSLAQQGSTLLLGWTIPAANLDGSSAEDLAGFRIDRLAYPAEGGCPTCREPDETVAEIALRYPQPAERLGKRLYWRDTGTRPGNGYRYAIVPVTVGGQDGEAATVHLALQAAPPAPENLQAVAGVRQASLQWEPPALAAGMQLLGYNLYRRSPESFFSLVPVNPKPLEQTTLTDVGLESGRRYEYRVSSLVQVDGLRVESLPTPGVTVAAQ